MTKFQPGDRVRVAANLSPEDDMVGVTGYVKAVRPIDPRYTVQYDTPVWRSFHMVNASADYFTEDQLELAGDEPGRVTTNPDGPTCTCWTETPCDY